MQQPQGSPPESLATSWRTSVPRSATHPFLFLVAHLTNTAVVEPHQGAVAGDIGCS